MSAALALLPAILLTSGQLLAQTQAVPGRECLVPPFADTTNIGTGRVAVLVERAQELLSPFPSLSGALRESDVAICLDDRTTDARGYLDVEEGLIAVSARMTPDEQLVILVHELRHLEQLTRGFCPSIDLSMEENARGVYAMEADAQSITTLVAWSSRENGDTGLWSTLSTWPDYQDISQSFQRAMEATGDLGAAASAAFAQWYASERRIEDYYAASCGDYLDRLDSTKRLPAYGMISPGFYDDLCTLPDGTPYDCAPPAAD